MEISYLDLLHPEYSCHLKVVTTHLGIIEACADVLTMCIPADNTLKLTASFCPMPTSSGPICRLANQPQPEVMVSGSMPVPPVIQWLREVIETQEGYAAFKQGQHHVQMDASVVVSWWFTVSFSEHYSQMVSPVQALASKLGHNCR